jgi:hypothetical protein
MIDRLIAGTKRPFGFHDSGHDPEVSPNDRFLVSYPTRNLYGAVTEAAWGGPPANLGYLPGVRYS